jgi:hypothetical protein
MSKGVQSVLLAIAALVLLGGSFYGGMVYGKQTAEAAIPAQFAERMARFAEEGGELPEPGEGFGQGGPGRFGGQGGEGGGGRMGQIEQNDGSTIIISSPDGSQTVVNVTDTTLIEKYAAVTAAELEVGEQVVVSGSENDDGSITARSIQVAQFGRFAPGGSQ